MFKRWIESILQNVVASVLIMLIPGILVTYLSKINSQWSGALLLGMFASGLSAATILVLRAQISLPVKRVVPTVKNIEGLIRSWLNNFRVTTKNAPQPDAHFRIVATMDSGANMVIGRPSGDLSDYILIRSDINPSESELEALGATADRDARLLILDINLELAKLSIGHSAIPIPIKPFHMFKRVPIGEGLTEHSFIAAMDEMEAAIAIIALLFGKYLIGKSG